MYYTSVKLGEKRRKTNFKIISDFNSTFNLAMT